MYVYVFPVLMSLCGCLSAFHACRMQTNLLPISVLNCLATNIMSVYPLPLLKFHTELENSQVNHLLQSCRVDLMPNTFPITSSILYRLIPIQLSHSLRSPFLGITIRTDHPSLHTKSSNSINFSAIIEQSTYKIATALID